MFCVSEKFGHPVSFFLEHKYVRNLILVAVWDFIEGTQLPSLGV